MDKKQFQDWGYVVITQEINDRMSKDQEFEKFVYRSFERYIFMDWGELSDNDKKLNDEALKNNLRIVASYDYNDKINIWIITEADRSVTTILFPSEY